MNKIKQLAFVLFIFSALEFSSYPVTQGFAQYTNSEFGRQLQLLQTEIQNLRIGIA